MLSLEEPLGPPGVGLAPGGGAPQPPLQTHPSGERPWPDQCARVFSCAATPPAWGAAVVSPAIHILKPMKWMPVLTRSKATGRHGRETTVTPHSGQVGGQEESPPDPTCLTYSRRTPRALAVLHRDDVYAACDERQMGALVELGAGLASGAQVFLVTDHQWSVAHHPRVRSFPNLAAAISAIVAMQNGERPRRAA